MLPCLALSLTLPVAILNRTSCMLAKPRVLGGWYMSALTMQVRLLKGIQDV